MEAEQAKPEAKVERPPPARMEHDLRSSEILPEHRKLKSNRTVYKERYRDDVDVINAEIGREYSADKAAQYKKRLLVLTRKLRQCGSTIRKCFTQW